MRFGSPSPHRQPRMPPSFRRQAWILLALLAVTIFAMRAIRQPATVEKLGQIFHLDAAANIPGEDPLPDRDLVLNPAPPAIRLETPGPITASAAEPLVEPEILKVVEDNTYLRKRERDAWLAVLTAVKQASPKKLERQSAGKVAQAALLRQPGVYRGRVISVEGTVLRQEELSAEASDVGIESYHRLVVAPAGGGRRPTIVYCLALPPAFPRGESLHEPMQTEAVFYKVWSYRSEDGPLELAPLAVAPAIRWSPAAEVAERKSRAPTWTGFAGGVALAAVFTALVVWRVAAVTSRRPRRRHHRTGADPTRAHLADLENQ